MEFGGWGLELQSSSLIKATPIEPSDWPFLSLLRMASRTDSKVISCNIHIMQQVVEIYQLSIHFSVRKLSVYQTAKSPRFGQLP